MTLQSESNSKYKSLLQAVRYLNSSMEVEVILTSLLEKSVELLDFADTGLIFLYNSEKNQLEVKSSYGFVSTAYEIILYPGESITGEAYESNNTIVVNGFQKVADYMENISFYKRLNKSADDFLGKQLSEVRGVIACPIRIKGICIGVLVVNNFSTDGSFNHEDVEILESISVQAALALSNAQTMDKVVEDRKQLRKYSKLIETEKNRYQYSVKLHNTFMALILKGATEKELVQELSVLLNSDICYINKFQNLVVSSQESLDNPLDITNITNHLSKKLSLYEACNLSYKQRFIKSQPILIDGENNGWIIIIRQQDLYTVEDDIAINLALTNFSLVILKQKQFDSLDQKYRGEFIDLLISGENKDLIKKYSNRYHLNEKKPYRMLLLSYFDNSNSEDTTHFSKNIENRNNYNNWLIPQLLNQSTNYFVANKIDMLIIILEEPEDGRRELETLMKNIIESNQLNFESKNDCINLYALTSELFYSMDDFNSIYSKMRKLINQLHKINSNSIFSFYEDYKVTQLLLNNDVSQLNQYMSDILGPLIGNPEKNVELLKTLKLYIQSKDNWSYTKDALFIHGNTLSQRLNRISKLLQKDLNDYANHMQIQLALEIYDIFENN